jgi:hypothetical protein
MTKINIVASMVQNETMADWNALLEDDSFRNLVVQTLKTKNNIKEIVKILSDFANNNLI